MAGTTPPFPVKSNSFVPYRQVAFLLWAGVAVATAAGSLLPHQTPDHFGASLDRFDKLQHLTAYIALGFTSQLPFRHRKAKRWAVLSMILFGGVLECLQTLVPGRSCDVNDMAANVLGVSIGYGLAQMTERLLSFTRQMVPATALSGNPGQAERQERS